MKIGKPSKAQVEALLLPLEYVERWLSRHRITWRQLALGSRVWKTSAGKIPLTIADVEELVAVEDPVAWAFMNLVEKKTLTIDGVVVSRAGDPWKLFQIQGELARYHGDLIVECGAEVGKTRDIVLHALWRADTRPGATAMIAGDSDQTLMPIFEEIEYQLERNPRIGGGLVEGKCHIKPNRKKVFRNGAEIEWRLALHDGKNFRGGHFTDGIYVDEAVKLKNPQQWSELWRSGLPGSFARIYSTPDGDYSSPFYSMCARAVSVHGPKAPGAGEIVTPDGSVRRFRKFHISKRQLPAPFWSEPRAAAYREQFGGEDTIGWITNIEGAWGSPSYSVFPMATLAPCLRSLEHYRVVTALVDRENRRVILSAAKLSPSVEGEGPPEQILFRDVVPLVNGRDLGRRIAAYFPDVRNWVSPKLYCGGDVGQVDPCEFIFVQVAGKKWTDVFRLHLRRADWEEQADILVQLDHISGHRVRYSIDNGSAGAALVLGLTKREGLRTCPECIDGQNALYFEERLVGRGFGEKVDEVDLETGEPILNPDDVDASGAMRPLRVSNKEFGTRILERKMQSGDLEIALDAGAGDQRLSGPQLMVNHTATGMNRKGERNFRGEDDHHVDARRQVALEIVSESRQDGFVAPDPAYVGSLPRGERSIFGDPASSIHSGFMSGGPRTGFF